MKRIHHYIGYHKAEIVYAAIACIGLILALVFKSWLPIIFVVLLYAVSIVIDFILFHFSKAPLEIKTPDGYNEPYHPSVLYFDKGWHGYRYWMAFTPMPKKAAHAPYTDRWECPCVYASNDGISFDVPVGGRENSSMTLPKMKSKIETTFPIRILFIIKKQTRWNCIID